MKYFKYILLSFVIFICCLIFFFSSQSAPKSDSMSLGVTSVILRFFSQLHDTKNTNLEALAKGLNHYFRKYAHFSLYFILGASSACTIFIFNKRWRNITKWLVVLAFCLLYATSDEMHQFFVSGRGSQASDVLLDFIGAFIGSGIIFSFLNRKREERDAPP